jgi:hypothetical protein
MADLLPALLEGLKAALRRERLPAPPEPGPRVVPQPSLLRQLFAPEQLGTDPEPLVSARPGVLSTIFKPERLGTDPPGPARRHVNWIAFLTRPERLDD